MSQGYNNLDFNNIYRNWLKGQIETANARGLMGGQTPGQVINQSLVRPIDNIINQAKADMIKSNRGVMVGNQGLVGRGPTSISIPKQLPAVTTGSNIVNPNTRMPKVQPKVNTPNVINMYPNNNVKLLTYDPTKKIVDTSLGKQTMFELPNGTYTSNPDLVKIAKQQMAKAAKLAKSNNANALMVFPELMNLWYGKDEYGTAGPGRAVLENSFIPLVKGILSTPEQRAQAQQEYMNKYKPQWMGGVSKSGGKSSGSNSDTGVPLEVLDDSQLTGGRSIQVNNKSGQVSGRPTTQAQALALAQQLGGNSPIANQQEADTQQANINAINDYISRLQEINQPYIESLQRFADNYGDLYNQNQLYNRRMRDLSAITGSPLWYQSAKDYNPLEVEATKIDLQKKIQDAQAGDLNAINEIMGNLAMAQEMGLPPEAAFANKNLLTMMAARDREANKYQIALENNLMKKYGIDRNYARALTVQAMRGQNALDVAGMYTGAYGNSGGVAPGLNKQGTASNTPASYDIMLQSAHNKNNR